jgi:hypothetical protein
MGAGINVSKSNAYAVLTPPQGVSVSKVCAYAVLAPAVLVPPDWGAWSFVAGTVGITYDQDWDMPTASSPLTYAVQSGALPDGLSLDAVSGNVAHIHGTPTTAGTVSFTLRASNAGGIVDKTFSIVIGSAPAGGGRKSHGYCW